MKLVAAAVSLRLILLLEPSTSCDKAGWNKPSGVTNCRIQSIAFHRRYRRYTASLTGWIIRAGSRYGAP